MTQYVALLRGVNLGKRTIKMGELRAAIEVLGFDDVATFIASGNVVFETAGRRSTATLEKEIERHLAETFGFEIDTFLRTRRQLAAVAAATPFPERPDHAPGTIYVWFLKAEPPATVRKDVLALATDTDRLAFDGSELYWWCPTRSTDATIDGLAVAKRLKAPSTNRNITSVRKLVAKFPPA